MSSLLMLRLELATSRDELDRLLSKSISEKSIRQFLLKSVKRTGDGKYQWQINIEALRQNLCALMDSVLPIGGSEPIRVPTLFLRGQRSNYVHSKGLDQVRKHFISYDIKTIPNAGHWVHAENPRALLSELNNFISNFTK